MNTPNPFPSQDNCAHWPSTQWTLCQDIHMLSSFTSHMSQVTTYFREISMTTLKKWYRLPSLPNTFHELFCFHLMFLFVCQSNKWRKCPWKWGFCFINNQILKIKIRVFHSVLLKSGAQYFFDVGSCSVYYRMFSSISGLLWLDAYSETTLNYDNQKYFQMMPNILWGAQLPLFDSHWSWLVNWTVRSL